MPKIARWFLVGLALAVAMDLPVAAQEFRKLHEGVEYLQITRNADAKTDRPLVIHLLRIDLRKVDVNIVHAMDEAVGLETVSSMAARHGAIAAVNAGFFATGGTSRGDNVSILKIDGRLLSEPTNRRAAAGFIKQNLQTEIIFGHLSFNGLLITPQGAQHKIDGLNRPRGDSELIVYTPEFHRTTLTLPNGLEIVVRRNRIAQIKDQSGSTLIPDDGLVISASGAAREWALKHLRQGQHVQLKMAIEPIEKATAAKWQQAQNVVGGVPQLLRDGRVEITADRENIRANFVSDRHPRTAIAKLNDGRMLLVVVDGRQPTYSVGISLTALAEWLLEFGAVEAINLDGGGSSTMFVDGKVVNKPSDASGERPVSDAILITVRR